MSSTSFGTCPNSTKTHLRTKGAIFDTDEKFSILHPSVRGALLTKESDSSFAEAHTGFNSEPTQREDEGEDQENEVEDERDCEECKVESRREGTHTGAWHMDGMTRTNTLIQCRVTSLNMRANTRNMWRVRLFCSKKVLVKEDDLGEPTSFLDHVYLGWTQRQCEISKDIVVNYRTLFESRISTGGSEQLPYSENFRISSWSYYKESHDKESSCEEMCGAVLWVGKQDDSTTI